MGELPCSLAQLPSDLCDCGEAEGCELGGGRCWALQAPHSCSLGRVRPCLLSPRCSCSITCRSWSLRAGQGLSPTPSCLEGGEGRRAGGLHLPESLWWACRDLACPHLPPPLLPVPAGHLLGLGGGDTPPAGTMLARAAVLALGQACSSGQSQLRPLPIPARRDQRRAGRPGRHGHSVVGNKGQEGQKEEKYPPAPSADRAGTELGSCGDGSWARLPAWHGKGCGKESPLLCPSDPSLWPRKTCRGNHHPQFSSRGATTTPLLVP